MKEKHYLAPCKSYTGKVVVYKTGQTTDTRGQTMIMVQALYGEPWSGWTSGGFVMTNRAIFYPEQLIPVDKEPMDTITPITNSDYTNNSN